MSMRLIVLLLASFFAPTSAMAQCTLEGSLNVQAPRGPQAVLPVLVDEDTELNVGEGVFNVTLSATRGGYLPIRWLTPFALEGRVRARDITLRAGPGGPLEGPPDAHWIATVGPARDGSARVTLTVDGLGSFEDVPMPCASLSSPTVPRAWPHVQAVREGEFVYPRRGQITLRTGPNAGDAFTWRASSSVQARVGRRERGWVELFLQGRADDAAPLTLHAWARFGDLLVHPPRTVAALGGILHGRACGRGEPVDSLIGTLPVGTRIEGSGTAITVTALRSWMLHAHPETGTADVLSLPGGLEGGCDAPPILGTVPLSIVVTGLLRMREVDIEPTREGRFIVVAWRGGPQGLLPGDELVAFGALELASVNTQPVEVAQHFIVGEALRGGHCPEPITVLRNGTRTTLDLCPDGRVP